MSGQSGRRSRSKSRRLVRNSETLDAVDEEIECFEGRAWASAAEDVMGLLEDAAFRRVGLVREKEVVWVAAMVASVS